MSDAGPLSPAQKEQLAAATRQRDKLLRPVRIARVNSWTVGVFGGLSALFGLLAGGSGIVVGLALIAVAWNELRGAKMVSALDPGGARILGWNQIVLAAVVAAYCGYAIVRAGAEPSESMRELEELGGISSTLVAGLTTIVYGAVAVIVVVVQALLARYHFKAADRIAAFRRDTPGWVVELLAT